MKKWTLAALAAFAVCLALMGGARDVKADELPTTGLDLAAGGITVVDSETAEKIKITYGSKIYDPVDPTAEIKVIQANAAGTATSNAIDVNASRGAAITLAGVNISAECAFHIESASGPVTLTLADDTTNVLTSRHAHAGLQKDSTAATSMLTIKSGPRGTGSLTAKGGDGKIGADGMDGEESGAGIGGRSGSAIEQTAGGCAYITIESGIISATGGIKNGSGIGGGAGGIHSGYEYGSENSAGGSCSHITINGGRITATGGAGGAGAGIGGGGGGSCYGDVANGGNCSDITINGGTITAAGGSNEYGDGIGSGSTTSFHHSCSCSNITICGGSIKAGSSHGKAIGCTPENGQNPEAGVYLTTVTLNDGTNSVNDKLISQLTTGNPNYYGTKDIYTDAEGKIYLWLPVGKVISKASVTGTGTAVDYLSISEIQTSAGNDTAGTLYDNSDVTITYAASAGGTVNPGSESIARVNGAAAGAAAAAASGYHFVNWTDALGRAMSTDRTFVPKKVNSLNKAAVYTANFAENTVYYEITAAVSPSAGGTVTGAGLTRTGYSLVLKAAANTGYAFRGWYESGKFLGTDALLTVLATGSRTITARFRAISSERLSGKNRYGTMAEAAKKAFPDGCDTAIFVSGANWPDAVTASSLAGAKGCPVILTEPGKLTQKTADILAFLKVKTVIIAGGPASVSEDVKTAVEKMGIRTDRIYGDSRTQTADKIEAEVMKTSKTDTVIVCSGQKYPDALSISAYAYAQKIPILLTGMDGKLTDESLAIAKTFKNAIIIGGQESVSGDVEKQLSGLSVKRCGGNSRYATSAMIINDLYGGYAPALAVTTGRNFPDALAAAALVGKSGGAILLVNGTGTSLSDEQKKIIGNAGDVYVFGGTGTVTAALKSAIDGVLKS